MVELGFELRKFGSRVCVFYHYMQGHAASQGIGSNSVLSAITMGQRVAVGGLSSATCAPRGVWGCSRP